MSKHCDPSEFYHAYDQGYFFDPCPGYSVEPDAPGRCPACEGIPAWWDRDDLPGLCAGHLWEMDPPRTYENPPGYRWLSLAEVARWEPLAAARGVSAVARGTQRSHVTSEGFVEAYRACRGRPECLRRRVATRGQTWAERRSGFVRRHLEQLRGRGEPLWDRRGMPTNRHLALIMWAYSPSPAGLAERSAPRPNPYVGYTDNGQRYYLQAEEPDVGVWADWLHDQGYSRVELADRRPRGAPPNPPPWALSIEPVVGPLLIT